MNRRTALMALLLVPVLTQTGEAQDADESLKPDGELSQTTDDLFLSSDEPSQPADEPLQLADEPLQLADEPLQLADESSQLADESSQPADEPSQPADEPSKPVDRPSIQVKGYFKLQTGLFVPLISDGFKAHENTSYEYTGSGRNLRRTEITCDPVETPNRPCYPLDHGQETGSLSMGRGTLQFELDWTLSEAVKLHANSRGVRAVKLPADEWAQIPKLSDNQAERRELAEDWVQETYYNEFELFRKLYLDARASDWLFFRIGRQFWSGTGKYQLLDVVNPHDTTWHFGPLESFEETRIPLWMVTSQIEISPINHSLELFWVPLIVVPVVDDDYDTVTVPLSLVGAWGIPYSNTPSPFVVAYKDFEYPGNRLEDMRAGLHWKGNLGSHMRYSLLYYYTHQLSPPIPIFFDQRPGDNKYLERLIMRFPRQHIAGLSLEYAFESPIAVVTPPFGTPAGLLAKLEATVEPERTYAVRSDSDSLIGGRHQDPNLISRYHFEPKKLMVVNYGISLTRPFLNPTVPVLLVGQFKHTLVPTYDEVDDAILVEIPGYNDYRVENSLMQVSFAVAAVTLKGFLVPKLIGALLLPDSGFYSLDLGFNFSPKVALHLTATDFFGEDPYQRLGLFRDRDEVNMSLTGRF